MASASPLWTPCAKPTACRCADPCLWWLRAAADAYALATNIDAEPSARVLN